ncbi:damage-inducible protein DinB [Tenacibaculum todarodis]|uniref:Damage-inducible protein DinB n=1 Tax=Tenacibaculum todarodis TaxID=1850252 RepID=A0A1L3JKQ2_9FLAO|nr:DinB family protein [Tenacibaculum todarodis]APG65701.1 damage-inducible protein DinB [Tenacibaculum todarodis]
MTTQFNILEKSRALTLKAIDGLTLEQLHKIPDGFKNNIAWNIAHLVVTQQLLQYKLSGLNCLCPEELIETYRKGTVPTTTFTQEEFDEVLELFSGLPETLQEDYEAGIFENYNEYPTSTGYVIKSIENAISFNNYHEGIHLGIIMSLKKFV